MLNQQEKDNFIMLLTHHGAVDVQYSGRNMNGDTCIGVILDDPERVQEVMFDMYRHKIPLDAPNTDHLGLDVIAYWPDIQVH